MVEIKAFRLERIFQPKRALEFITGHGFQKKETIYFIKVKKNACPQKGLTFGHIALYNANFHSAIRNL